MQWFSNTSSTWELVINAHSWTSPRSIELESLKVRPSHLCFKETSRWFWTNGYWLGEYWLRRSVKVLETFHSIQDNKCYYINKEDKFQLEWEWVCVWKQDKKWLRELEMAGVRSGRGYLQRVLITLAKSVLPTLAQLLPWSLTSTFKPTESPHFSYSQSSV